MTKIYLLSALVLMSFSSCQFFANEKKANAEKKVNDHEQVAHDQGNTTSLPAYFQAALNGDLDGLKSAIEQGVDVNVKDENAHTALMLSAYNGHHHVMAYLIEKEAQIDAVDGVQRTALMFACTGPFLEAVELLINAGAEVNAVDSHESWTPAMMAAAEGQLDVLKLLVKHGADLSMVDVDGESSLDFAKSNGHGEVASYITALVK
ncbi:MULTISPECIES: ankyrin repeat domain-containing protein [unclassified Carboxylicivirga]|uniref:ankyrin repeat domain-containing protein n=1 Tax=Carboxylicivirga TaxID=1628153 RepID=UPI003D341102